MYRRNDFVSTYLLAAYNVAVMAYGVYVLDGWLGAAVTATGALCAALSVVLLRNEVLIARLRAQEEDTWRRIKQMHQRMTRDFYRDFERQVNRDFLSGDGPNRNFRADGG